MFVCYRRAILVAAAAAGIAGCADVNREQILASVDATATQIPVTLVEAVESDVATHIELVGSTIPKRRSIIVSEVDGVIQEIPTSEHPYFDSLFDSHPVFEKPRLDLGVDVSEGDVLVRLDPTRYELQLQTAEAHLNTVMRQAEHLRAWQRAEEIRQKEATLDEAAARVKLAELDLKRTEGLIERNATTQATLEKSQTDLTTARAVLARAEAELTIAKAGPTQAEIAVVVAAVQEAQAEVEQAKWHVDRTTIRAPYDGVVTERYVDKGDSVTAMPRVEILELMDLSVLTAELCVPERYINQLHVGDAADVFVRNRAEPVRGMVVLINEKVDPTNRTFRIRVGIDNVKRQFKVGQFVRVSLEIDSATSAVTVPTDAITYSGGEALVYVYGKGRVNERHVQLGLQNEKTVQILSGLSLGEAVVVDDPSILSDGMPVQVRTPERTTEISTNLR